MDMGIDNIQIQFLSGGYRKELPQPEEVLLWHQIADRDFWLDESEITWDNTAWLMQYIMYLNEHEADDMTPIKIHIMSPGGHLYVMFALYDAIKNSKIPVYTYNEGICHSAAFLIYLGGQKRFMRPNAVFCAHEGSALQGGTYRESKAAMAQYDIEVTRMKELIAEETNMDLDFLNHKFEQNSDWYIRHDEAKELGILKE